MWNCPYARCCLGKWPLGTKKEMTRHEDSNPMISCLGPLVTRWGGGGSATSTHGQLQPTVKEHTQQHSSQQGLLLRGPAQGLGVTDTRRKASGHCVRPHLTHWHGDGWSAAPSPPHTYTQIPESSSVETRVKAWQARIQTLHKEIGRIQRQVWPQSNVRALFTCWEMCQVTRKHNQTERDKGMSFLPESNQTAIKKSSG